jgi:DNA helicase HerA-like ATPase
VEETLGRITGLAGSRIMVTGQNAADTETAVRVGSMVVVRGTESDVVGVVDSMELDVNTFVRRVAVTPLGELTGARNDGAIFHRGISHPPALGAFVEPATAADLQSVYVRPSAFNVRIGTLSDDESQPAYVMVDELLSRHFAVVGASGSGKSCAVTLILSAILAQQPNAHVILLDPHNEYTAAFGDLANVLNVDNLNLPLWLFNLEEAVRILVRGGTHQEQDSQALILKDAITRARRHHAGADRATGGITVDTPTPFTVHDILRFLNEEVGRLNKADAAISYLRLRSRLESLREDRRFSFLFTDTLEKQDLLSKLVGSLLSIPVAGKPLTIIDLSGVPSEIADVVVSLSCRVMFDFTLWSDPERRPPILLVCEEAHRYLPQDEPADFAAGARAITRIAKEGRKYGLSLALVSQRPSELSLSALSQCGTVFALRMGNEHDQRFVERALPESGYAMLSALPSLPAQQAVVFGEGVSVPMRIRFDEIPLARRPRSESAIFSEAWREDSAGDDFREEGIRRWRTQSRSA